MKMLHLAQALTNGGKVSKYLEEQLNSHQGNTLNVLNVIHAIESDYKHEFMKKAGKLRMFKNLNVFHHHVNWHFLENTIHALNNDKNIAPHFHQMIDNARKGKINAAEVIEKFEPLFNKAIGIDTSHKTGQWLIHIKNERYNYYIGIFDHPNDLPTMLKNQLESTQLGNKINIIFTNAANNNKPYSPQEQEQLKAYSKKLNDEKLKKQIEEIITKDFPELLQNLNTETM